MAMQFSSQRLKVAGMASSMIGGRPDNQDSWGYGDTPLGFLLVVCDGMGGGPGGKLASQTVVNEILRSMIGSSSQMSPVDALKRAVAQAEQALDNIMQANPALRGMGSTLVAVLVSEQSAHVAHLGDSRCYRISQNKVAFRTDDHSLVGELVRNKAMTEEQARLSPQSNVITRALGNTNNHVAQISEVSFMQGDRFVLCTDGVWGVMPHEQLVQRFTAPVSIADLVVRLSEEVDRIGHSEGGHFDNHTIAVLETNMNSKLQEKMNRTIKIIIGVLALMLLISVLFNLAGNKGDNSQITVLQSQISGLQAELDKQNSRNSDLEGYKLRYEQLTRERSGSYSLELDWLMRKNDSLNNVIIELEQRISALQDQIVNQQENGTTNHDSKVTKDKEEKPVTQVKGKSFAYARMTAKECVKAMLVELETMRDAKSKKMAEVTSTKTRSKDIIENLMIQLDQKTSRKYEEKIAGMRRILNAPDGACLNADLPDKQGYYRSTRAGIRDIQVLIGKTQEIQKDLK